MAHPYHPAAARYRNKRRWPRRLLVAIVLLLILAWFAPAIVAKTGLRNQILASATAELNGTLSADDASFGWLSPIVFRGISLKDSKGQDVARAESVTTDSSLIGLLRNARSLGSLRVEKPSIDIVCEDTGTNLEAVLARYLDAPSSAGDRFALTVQIVDGSLTVRNPDRSVSHTLSAVNGDVAIPASRGEPIRMKFRSGTDAADQLKVEAENGNQGRVVVVGKQVPLAVVGLIARRFEPGVTLSGSLATDVTVTWSKDSFAVDGLSTAKDFEVGGSRLGPDRLKFARVELPTTFIVKGNALTAEKLKVICDAGTLSLAGTFDLAGELDTLVDKPGLKAEADINLTKLATLMPRLFHVRPGTELSGGQLKIGVASASGPGGTVWTGELSTSAIRGVRDGRPIVWDSPLRAAFALRLGPDRWPVFDKLEAQSDFIGLAARGSAESFQSAATIDLGKLQARLGDFVDLEGVQLGGLAEVRLNSKAASAGGFAVDAKATLTRFAAVDSKGVGLREPELVVTLAADAKKEKGVVRVERGKVTLAATGDSAELSLTEPVTDVAKLTSGKWNLVATGDLARWQNRLRTVIVLPPDLALNGNGRLTGTVAVVGQKVGFDGSLAVERLSVGPPAKPTWTEPNLTLAVKGDLVLSADALRLERIKVDRDGLAVETQGRVNGLSATQDVQFDGTVAYDLAKLEPKLREYLGKGAKASGADSRPFHIAGKLDRRMDTVDSFTGFAAVGWKSVKAYGFDVGPAELKATLDKGIVNFTPVAATFGGGQVRVTPTMTLTPDVYPLTFAKGKVIDKAKLTPAACADAMGYVLPAIANAAQAEGLVSFDLGDNRIPLSDPTKAFVKGTLTLHAVKVSPGPVATEIATLLGATNVSLTLANEQPVGVRVENGRVHHDSLSLDIRGYAVKTSGSVGFDGSLSLVAEVPLPAKLIEQALAGRPILKDALANRRVSVPIGGTLQKPRLDPKAFQAATQKLVQDAIRAAAEEALKKGLQGLIPPPKKK